ncbi:carbohydrate-binding module family 13 protein [Hebeloma cylindrosporum]|uniref:Carbohydrate-binding module family 13 protein n=1 Tax=Hebeloma cylindrosporum TaxID=76867 RepID=A0A0C3CIH4_HEBCY|nr:carbohydrate-binding module family 13 protein [Hebeloma cylindrosporum h7]
MHPPVQNVAAIENGGRYIIHNSKSKTVLDLNGSDGRTIIGFPRHGGENQQWETIYHDGGWHIKSVGTDKYLNLESHPKDDVRLVAIQQPFLWHLWDDDRVANAIRICVPNTRQNVDLTDYGNPNPGTPVAIWGRWEGENQTWKFEKVH